MSGPTTPEGFAARLPVGDRLPVGELAPDDLFPFEGEIRLRPLASAVLPVPQRRGEGGGEGCWNCAEQQTGVLWSDDRWLVRHGGQPSGLPLVLTLIPRAHCDLESLPPDVAADLGILLQRVATAMMRIPGIGRVHVNRWGDGTEHFHVWLLARPRGQWQMRGAMLAVWDDLLPKLPEDEWRANLRVVAEAMAEPGDGAAPS